MKTSAIIFILFLPIALSAQNFPAGRLIPAVTDLRSAAMGLTSIVSARNANSIFSNPSMIGMIENLEMIVGWRLNFGSINDEELEHWYNDLNNTRYSSKYTPHIGFGSISAAFPLKLPASDWNFAIGVGYNTYFDGGYKIENKLEDESFKITFKMKYPHGLNTISPAFSAGYKNRYYLGISYNRSYPEEIAAYGETTVSSGTDKSEIEQISQYTARFFLIGGFVKVTSKLNIVFMYRPGFRWDYTSFRRKVTIDGNLIEDTKREGQDITLPGEFGIGADFSLTEYLKIAVEYQYKNYANYILGGHHEQEISGGKCLRLGVEARFRPISVRFGIFSDDIAEIDYNSPNPVPLRGVTSGAGFTIRNRLTLDAAFIWSAWKIKGQEIYDYSESHSTIRFSAGYKL